jgi:hypothetical protein
MRKKRIKKLDFTENFIILNSEGKYFGGLHNGGQFKWVYSIKDAKPLSDLCKFEYIKRNNLHLELIYEYV